MAFNINMQAVDTRLKTFQTSSKRASSSQNGRKKAASSAAAWPHKALKPKDFANAGFYFNPSSAAPDNTTCFFCGNSLADWEDTDIPLNEHVQHSRECQWAQCKYAGVNAQRVLASNEYNDEWNPMSAAARAARRATFEQGRAWPHEKKRGWKCKISKMVDAGWCFDPDVEDGEDEELDGATCFYCERSVSGWEPKDEPVAVHQKDGSLCPFFVLAETFKSSGGKKTKASKGVRASNASKTSRLSAQSIQSAMSTFSEQPSLADSSVDLPADVDDSVMTAATNSSQATLKVKGKSSKGKARTASKSTKGRSKAASMETQEPLYPDISNALEQSEKTANSLISGKTTRTGLRQDPRTVDSSVMEISAADFLPPPKRTKRKQNATAELDVDVQAAPLGSTLEIYNPMSEQLQGELDQSLSTDMDAKFEQHDSIPEPQREKATSDRGTKRTSDGVAKSQQRSQGDSQSTVTVAKFPVPPQATGALKAKKGRKASKQQQQVVALSNSQDDLSLDHMEDSANIPTVDAEISTTGKAKKAAPSKKATKGRKASSTKSSRSSKATDSAAESANLLDQRITGNLGIDELEIEAELSRIAAEEAAAATFTKAGDAMEIETDKVEEYEPSPSREKRSKHSKDLGGHVDAIQKLERELEAEVADLPDPSTALAVYIEAVARPSPANQKSAPKHLTPSPSGSDKENVNSSARQPVPEQPMSPTKTMLIPLAPGTPNRASASPSKHLSRLVSGVPWNSIDVENVLLASPNGATPRTLAARFAQASGALTSPEKELTVEQWVQAQAAKGEADLQRRCEDLVTRFEREGNRALTSLEGIAIAGR